MLMLCYVLGFEFVRIVDHVMSRDMLGGGVSWDSCTDIARRWASRIGRASCRRPTQARLCPSAHICATRVRSSRRARHGCYVPRPSSTSLSCRCAVFLLFATYLLCL